MINAIVAIGKSGQIGLNGRLPWHDKEDLAWFKAHTMGKVCIAGWNTYATLPKLPGRRVVIDSPGPCELLLKVIQSDEVWIIGGAKTYARWAHMIDRWYVSVIDYDGEADTYLDLEILDGKDITWRNDLEL